MYPKQEQMKELIQKIKANTECENIKSKYRGEILDKSLVNHFKLHELIPNKWFDWERRADAKIMIIGQDWGPYIALKKYVDDYETSKDEPDFDYDKFLFKSLSSRTEKFIIKVIEDTYRDYYGDFNPQIWEEFFFTMAVLFTRPGKHFRGNHNFDEKRSYEISYPYVSEQITIVQPKVIVTLGGLGFKAVNDHFKLGLEKKTVTQIIKDLTTKDHIIQLDNTTIIPNFHPASHTSPILQKQIWSQMWKYI
jgi:uracil-DNA glycosylase